MKNKNGKYESDFIMERIRMFNVFCEFVESTLDRKNCVLERFINHSETHNISYIMTYEESSEWYTIKGILDRNTLYSRTRDENNSIVEERIYEEVLGHVILLPKFVLDENNITIFAERVKDYICMQNTMIPNINNYK